MQILLLRVTVASDPRQRAEPGRGKVGPARPPGLAYLYDSSEVGERRGDRPVRLSRFNLTVPSKKGELLLFNPWTCALVGLEPDFYHRYLDPETGDPNLASADVQTQFLEGHFTVPDGVDELEQYRFERARARFATDRLDLVLSPTMNCNLACVYCFETVRRPGLMSSDAVARLKAFVSERLTTIHTLTVTWYGGEPLMAQDVIRDIGQWLSAETKARHVSYAAKILTNGLLLTPKVAKTLQAGGITLAQVNLDGRREVHDRRRPRAGGGGTYDTIIRNLLEAPPDLQLAIRVGVDNENREECWRLYDTLLDLGLAQRHSVLIRPICESPGVCQSAAESCLGLPGFFSWYLGCLGQRLDAGLSVAGLDDLYPQPTVGCMSQHLNLYMVDPDGDFQRCLEHVGVKEQSVGRLGEPLTFGPVLQAWMSVDPLRIEGCRECRLLPLCGGGCPARWLERGRPECSPYQTTLTDILRLHDRWPATEAHGPDTSPAGGAAIAKKEMSPVGPA